MPVRRQSMSAPAVPYIEWIKQYLMKPKYNLALSSVRALRQEEVEGGFLDIDYSEFNYDEFHLRGPADLRIAIAKRFGCGPGQVLCTTGTSHANFLACAALLEPGDEAVVEVPGYGPLQKLPEFFGETLKGALEIAADAGAHVICDEVYREFLGDAFPTAWGMGDNLIVTSSLTKYFGMGGVRMGWAIAGDDMLERLSSRNDYVVIVSSTPSMYMGMSAFRGWDRLVERTGSIAMPNRAIVDEWIATEDRAEWVPPDGCIISFPRLTASDGRPIDSLAFVDHLLETQETLAGPGALFGAEGHLRVGFGSDPELVREGLKRLSAALDTWKR
jgi:aspartate/methionine/tyrosine aminotransferase